MGNINLLEEDIINKIAAGEVIERPASVVKELIENSIDSGATKILIEVKDSGKEMIRVSDDGQGMDEQDARMAIIRHATSKINSINDLYSIATLGFRGEALASISAVSQLSILTKQKEKVEGFNIAVEGGKVISTGIMAADQGTSIEVANLFFNTPARKKFMKSDQVELRHIIEVVTHYALFNKKISFKLLHDGHQLLNSPSVDDWKDNIASIYGIGVAKDLFEVNYDSECVNITGYVSKPYQVRNDKNQQALFVNGRWVKNEDVSKAVYDAYHSMLFVNKHPIFVLNLKINPEKVDVNVHPHKKEIKIEQREEIYGAVLAAVKQTLQGNNLIPSVEFSQIHNPVKKVKYKFEPSKQTVLEEPKIEVKISQEIPELITEVRNNLPEMKILGQIQKTYFAAETPGGFFLIDQHAAHERVLYERFMEQYMKKNVKIQTLLQAEIVEFTPMEKSLIEENMQTLHNFGFGIESFGDSSYLVKTMPLVFGRLQAKKTIFEMLSSLKDGNNNIEMIKEQIVTRMACRAAVMAGDSLTNFQMENIIRELSKTESPYTCPHGRPSIIMTSVDELEKKFKRA